MSIGEFFEIKKYEFGPVLLSNFQENHYVNGLWPLVYILSDAKIREAYVGETTDALSRMGQHLKNNSKNKLTAIHLITSNKFNKSATLDIESNLIKYLSGDGMYKLLNANIGLANHTYYQKKEVYWDIFKIIWGELKSEGITNHSLAQINNSDLFKYSPYKSLTIDQKEGIVIIIKSLLNAISKNIIVEGGAGTGKTILATYLFKLLNTDLSDFNLKEFGDEELAFLNLVSELKRVYPNPSMALVVPMPSFRNTIKKVFKNIKGLNAKMVIGPAEVSKNKYDILIVDEAHRLRRRVNLGTYFGAFDNACKRLKLNKFNSNELDWIIKQGTKKIFFYDEGQSIKPSDVKKEDFDKLKVNKNTTLKKLKSQFRVRGGNDYVTYIDHLLNCKLKKKVPVFSSTEYEFLIFDSVEIMINRIKSRNEEFGLSRVIAGYAWEWVSRKQNIHDIIIDNVKLKWNRATSDWVNSENSINEVGCIHTTQGYDLNYAGIIFGNEISYDKNKQEITIQEENYFDRNGKQSIKDPKDLRDYVINIYKTMMLRGIRGTYIFVCDKNLREYFEHHITLFENERGFKVLSFSDVKPYINGVPLYDISIAAGAFSSPQNASDYEWIELPKPYKCSEEYFVCKVRGESMNKKIPNGSWCLFKKDTGGSRNGKIVLVEHRSIQDPDFGSGYTVKLYESSKVVNKNTWRHQKITLKPLSNTPGYENIVLFEDDLSVLKVIGIFVGVLKPEENID